MSETKTFTILFCPLCNTNQDVEVPEETVTARGKVLHFEIECNNCGAKVELTVTIAAIKEHGMYG